MALYKAAPYEERCLQETTLQETTLSQGNIVSMSTQKQFKFERPTQYRAKFREKNRGSVIIQCPSCQTKFSVNTDMLNEHELPRFHCSRCDHVFDMEAKPESIAIDNQGKAPSKIAVTTSAPTAILPPILQEEPPISPSFNILPENIAEKNDSTTVKPTLLSSPILDQSKSLQIPRTIDETIMPSAPHESNQLNEFEQLSMNLTSSQTDSPIETPPEDSDSLPYGVSIGKPYFDNALQKEAHDAAKEIAQALSGTTNDFPQRSNFEISPPSSRSDLDIIPHDDIELVNHRLTPQVSPWRGFFVLLTPLLFTLAMLSIWAFILSNSPNISERFADSLGSSLPKFAPAGLRVEGIKFNKIILDSGEVVHTIQGKLKNDSVESIDEIIVEGLVFDKSGKLITHSKINAASSLADSRIKSLPLEMIQNLQRAKPSKRSTLVPGADQSFVVALIDEEKERIDLSKAAYFSARIHSVRN